MSKQAAEHHLQAAEHHEHAARHHREAAKHHEAGDHELAAHRLTTLIPPKVTCTTLRTTPARLQSCTPSITGTKPRPPASRVVS